MFYVHTYVKYRGNWRPVLTKGFHNKWDAKRLVKKIRALPKRRAIISWDCLNEDCVPSPTVERREAMTDPEILLWCGTFAQLVCDKEKRLHHIRTAPISTATEYEYTNAIYAIDAAIDRRFSGMLDLENDLYPFGHGEERELNLACHRMLGFDHVRDATLRIKLHCDEEARAFIKQEFPFYVDYGMHPDDCECRLDDPMDFNAVY